MLKRILLVLLIASLASFALAEAEYTVNDRSLTDIGIEELYALEDAVVSALSEVFERESSKSPDGDITGTFVVNPKTKKFHFPYCYSALEIGGARRFVTCAASELVARGFKPCGKCKPVPEAK